jgi:hypothetical protein
MLDRTMLLSSERLVTHQYNHLKCSIDVDSHGLSGGTHAASEQLTLPEGSSSEPSHTRCTRPVITAVVSLSFDVRENVDARQVGQRPSTNATDKTFTPDASSPRLMSAHPAYSIHKLHPSLYHTYMWRITIYSHHTQISYQPISNRPLGLVVKRITSTPTRPARPGLQMIRSLVRFWQRAFELLPSLSSLSHNLFSALWRSGYRARLEILFLRERRFESCQRRNFWSSVRRWGGVVVFLRIDAV